MNQKARPNPHFIVVGNEKGGTGKTTISMHLICQLLYDGHKVTSIDIDSRQRSLSNYLKNRHTTITTTRASMPFPSHFIVNKSTLDSVEEAEADETSRFTSCLEKAAATADFIVIDAPGSDTFLSRLAHSYAHTVITPINDSFIDLDVIAKISEDTLDVDIPGVYSEMMWDAKIQHAKRYCNSIDWIVLRNRLTNIDAGNKRRVSEALKNLENRVGCRLAEGFSERVIYKELFLKGLTLLDIVNQKTDITVNISHITARQELRRFMDFLGINAATTQEVLEPENKITTATALPQQEEEEVTPPPAFDITAYEEIQTGYLTAESNNVKATWEQDIENIINQMTAAPAPVETEHPKHEDREIEVVYIDPAITKEKNTKTTPFIFSEFEEIPVVMTEVR